MTAHDDKRCSSNNCEFYYDKSREIKGGKIKLDQETWLCRTQLDDFLVKFGLF